MRRIIKNIIKWILSTGSHKTIKAQIYYAQPNRRLEGKKIIVTGGTHGIGFFMAKRFKSEGANVIITGRNAESLVKAADEIGCQWLVLDVKKTECFDGFINEANKKLPGINCLVNNAGISLHEKSFFDVTPESFDQQFSTNFRGPFFLTQSFISYLKANNIQGEVLFVSSETGFTADFRPYGYTKSAINSMVEGLAYLFAKDNIRINAVAPGITATDMTGYSKDDNLYCHLNTTERAYLPEEVAEVACFLLSDISGCISGQIVTCNNGRTINARVK